MIVSPGFVDVMLAIQTQKYSSSKLRKKHNIFSSFQIYIYLHLTNEHVVRKFIALPESLLIGQ